MRRLLFLAALLTASPATAQTAEERLDELEARIARLEDLNAIERLQKAYGYLGSGPIKGIHTAVEL